MCYLSSILFQVARRLLWLNSNENENKNTTSRQFYKDNVALSTTLQQQQPAKVAAAKSQHLSSSSPPPLAWWRRWTLGANQSQEIGEQVSRVNELNQNKQHDQVDEQQHQPLRWRQLSRPDQNHHEPDLIVNFKPAFGDLIGHKEITGGDNMSVEEKRESSNQSDINNWQQHRNTPAATNFDDDGHEELDSRLPMDTSTRNTNNNNNNNSNELIRVGASKIGESDANQFRIRTSNRRHLDFDDEFDLSDANARARTKWSGPFYFIQAADSQFGMIDSYVHKKTEPGWLEEIELCESLVRACNQMTPRPLFMIICGDLVDSFPCSEIGQKQVVDFKRIFAKLDDNIPLVCVCGNHDVGNEPTRETIMDYRKTFGDDYFYFTKNDVLFIVINSQFYQHRDYVQDIASEQDQWLLAILEKCNLFKYSIVFEHIPWFLNDAQEEDGYFNIKKEVRLKWLQKFKEAGVSKIMCGHYHRNAGGWFEGMELIVTSAIGAQCGSDKSGIRIVRVLDGSIQHQYYAMPDIPLRIEL